MRTKRKVPWLTHFFDNLAKHVTRIPGKPMVFIFSFILVIIWALTGPIFEFSDTWQLVINTGTTFITFLMIFVIQQTQNKHPMAVQQSASNRLVDIKDLTDDELQVVNRFYVRLAELAFKSNDMHSSHLLDDPESYHEMKSGSKSTPKYNGSTCFII